MRADGYLSRNEMKRRTAMPLRSLVDQPKHDFIILRRVEGAAICMMATLVFAQISGNWWLFAGLLLLPDVAMVGYFAGPRVGALAYNALHTYIAPACLGLVGLALDLPLISILCAIWVAHIGFDRALGYGLKFSTSFKHTHLSGPPTN